MKNVQCSTDTKKKEKKMEESLDGQGGNTYIKKGYSAAAVPAHNSTSNYLAGYKLGFIIYSIIFCGTGA